MTTVNCSLPGLPAGNHIKVRIRNNDHYKTVQYSYTVVSDGSAVIVVQHDRMGTTRVSMPT